MTVRNTAATSPDRTALPDLLKARTAPGSPGRPRRPAPAGVRIGDYELTVDSGGRLVATHGATGGTWVIADPNPAEARPATLSRDAAGHGPGATSAVRE